MVTPVAYGSLRSHPSQKVPTVGRGVLSSTNVGGSIFGCHSGSFFGCHLHPSFNIDKDKDLNRILAVLESTSPSITDERSQLYATLEECVDSSDLIDFFSPKKTHEFFLKKNKEITEVIIPLNDKKADIIKSVASRVYDIRCRIVHTKDLSGSTKPLLPNSPGAENLNDDIKLLEFLAIKVIIAASIPLTI